MDRFDAMRVFTRIVERRSFTLAADDWSTALLGHRCREGTGGAVGGYIFFNQGRQLFPRALRSR